MSAVSGAGPLDPDRVLFTMLSAELQSVVRRCCAVARFDNALFTTLVPDDPDDWFGRLRSAGLIENVESGEYGIREGLRRAAWNSLNNTAQRELAGLLRDHFDQPENRYRKLSQLALLAPEDAEREFVELFNAAAASFNHTACANLLRQLTPGEGVGQIPQALVRLRDKYRGDLLTRTAWESEYRMTDRYLSRSSAEERLTAFLEREEEKVLWLYARAGIGKSMQLNWLLARHFAVHQPEAIPAARIDLSGIDEVALNRPWLLLVEAALQLHRQVPDSSFEAYIDRYGSLDEALRPDGWGEDLVEERAREFGSILAGTARGSQPVVVALDTVEGPWARMPDARERIIHMIKTVCEEAAAGGANRVKFILAARLSPERAGADWPGLVAYELAPFNAKDCRDYLVKIRGLSEKDPVTKAIIEQCKDGIPLTLALYADIAKQKGVTAEQIRNDDSPKLHYALNRNLHSLPTRLRIPALFAAATRGVSADLFALIGEHLQNVPADPQLVTLHGKPWNLAETEDPATAFRALEDHVDAFNWMTRTADGKVAARPEVRGPLRELLLQTCPDDLADFHARVAVHYSRAAAEASSTAAWARARIEELYHLFWRFEAAGRAGSDDVGDAERAAVGTWRDAVAEAWRGRDPDLVTRFALEVFSAEFGGDRAYIDAPAANDAAGVPGALPAAAVMPIHVWYEAYLELAAERAARADKLQHSRWDLAWQLVRERLGQAEEVKRLAAEISVDVETSEAIRTRRIELELRCRVAVETEKQADQQEAAKRIAETPGLPGTALATLANAGPIPLPGNLSIQLRQNFELALATSAGTEEGGRVAEGYVRWLIGRGEAQQAVAIADKESARAGMGAEPERFARIRARALLAAYRPGSAETAMALTGEPTLQDLWVWGRTQLALLRPGHLISEFAGRSAAARADEETGWALDCELLLARAHGELLDIRAVEQSFRRCLVPSTEPPLAITPIETAAAATQLSLVYLEKIGNITRATEAIRRAWKYLDELAGSGSQYDALPGQPSSATRPDEPLSVRHSRAAIFLVRAMIAGADAAAHDEAVPDDASTDAVDLLGWAEELLADAQPADRAFAHLIALSIRSVAPEVRLRHLDKLTQILDGLPSGPDRLAVLGRLSFVPRFPSTPAWHPAIAKFAKVVGAPASGSISTTTGYDAAAQGLVLAEIARVIGDSARAKSGYESSCRRLTADDPYAWWHLYCNHPYSRLDAPDDAVDEFDRTYRTSHPLMTFAFLTETATRREADGANVVGLLERAGRIRFRGRPLVTRWHTRHAEVSARAAKHGDLGNVRQLEARRLRTRAALGHGTKRALAVFDPSSEVVLRIGDSPTDKITVLTTMSADEGNVVNFGLPASIRGATRSDFFVRELDKITADSGPVDSLAPWSDMAEFDELKTKLFAALQRFSPRHQCDLRIEIADSRLARVPWEVLRVGTTQPNQNLVPLPAHPVVRHVYRAVASRTQEGRKHSVEQIFAVKRLLTAAGDPPEGVDAKEVLAAVNRFQARVGLPKENVTAQTWGELRKAAKTHARPPRVVVARLGAPGTAGSDREIEKALLTTYLRSGLAEVLVTSTGTQDELEQFIGEGQPDVIHLLGEMTIRRKEPGVSFGFGAPPLFAVQLSSMIRDLVASEPLVILDVLRPPRRISAIEQLVLRNEFAHQLLAYGRVQAVLGVGLDTQDGDVHPRVPRALAAHFSAAELRTRVYGTGPGAGLSTSGAALFASVPPDALVPAGLWDPPPPGSLNPDPDAI